MRGSNGWVIGVGLVALGCGDVEVGDESGNPFGDGTASTTSTTTPGTTRGTAEDTAGTQGSQGTASTTDGPTTDASTAEGSSGPTTGPTTGSATTTASESSGGPGEGQLLVSGFKVYPNEVESVACSHPAVREAAAVGVPHPHSGEAVKAFVVTADGFAVEEDDVIAWCAEQLARYKCPSKVMFVDELPHNVNGKVLRRSLR